MRFYSNGSKKLVQILSRLLLAACKRSGGPAAVAAVKARTRLIGNLFVLFIRSKLFTGRGDAGGFLPVILGRQFLPMVQ
jgi:hypothetical protein